MMVKVNYGRMVSFLGRNGTFKQSGVIINSADVNTKTVEIVPITSKGMEGRAVIEIPVECLEEVVEALIQFKKATAKF